MIKVDKFGGSSLASAEQFAKAGDIVRSDEDRKYVVPSAPGKRNGKDSKVTYMLYDCYRAATRQEDIRISFNRIKERYNTIINGLGLKLSLEEEYKKIEKNLKDQIGEDYAASRGEYLNARSKPSAAAAPILPVPLSQKRRRPACMKTGRTFRAVWWRTPGSSKTRSRSAS